MLTPEQMTAIQKQLDAAIPRDVISQREGGSGRSLAYLEGWYVIDRLNQVLGSFGWESSLTDLKLLSEEQSKNKFGKEVYIAHYYAHVTLTARFGGSYNNYVNKSGVGYGNGMDKTSKGAAHELAIKEAFTDALKRAAMQFGRSMGLALYDKTQEYVIDVENTGETRTTSTAAENRPASEKPTHAAEKLKEKAADEGKLQELIQATAKVIRDKNLKSKEELQNIIKIIDPAANASRDLSVENKEKLLNQLNQILESVNV